MGARGRGIADPGFYRCGGVVQGLVCSTIGDPDLRSPSGFDFGLSPSAQDDTEAEMFAQSLGLRRISGVIFLASRQIKKLSPVGEGGPRQWWMRSSQDKLTLCRHLIRQPSAATFSHWRRLSFVHALPVNKYGCHCLKVGVKSASVSS